ncbi:hypothetical protein BJY00DRAFT_316254 [Aspergillus carlsbadensis]|nr:hypothetical protein BJY00DRAFT_316254 [Aspergillus carlsbadensis]
MPLKGSISYSEAAEKCGLDAGTIRRILGFLMGYHIFYQPERGRVAHSRLSHAMTTDEGLIVMAEFCIRDSFGYSYHIADALAKWGASGEPNETGFNIAENTKYGMYEWADRRRQYWKCQHPACAPLLEVEIYRARLGSVCQRGESLLPADLRGRIQSQANDMFQEQAQIPDRKVVYFPRAIVPALKPGDRTVLSDQILPEPGTASPTVERLMRFMDMTILSEFNGQERTAEHVEELTRAGDCSNQDSVYPYNGHY